MIIEFDHIKIAQFGAITNEVELSFADLGQGVHFVQGLNNVDRRLGSNGASKSTIFNAMSWCLYGKTLAGLRGTDVIPWETKLKPDVTVKIWTGDGDSLKSKKIRRSTITNGLWINGKVVNQETIDDLLQLSFDTFCNTIALGQSADLFFDLKATAKMDILSDALNLDRWDERSARAKKAVQKLDTALLSFLQQSVALEAALLDQRETLTTLKNKSADWEGERADAEEARAKRIRQTEKLLNDAENEFATHDLNYDNAETELRHAQTKLDEITATMTTLSGENAAHVARRDDLRIRLTTMSEDVRRFGKAGDCPVCGSQMSKAHKAKHIREMEDAIEKLNDDLAAETLAHNKSKIKFGAAEVSASKWVQSVREFRRKGNDAVDSRARAETKCSMHKATLASLKDKRTQSDNAENPFSDMIAKVRDMIRDNKRQQAENKTASDATERNLTYTKYWVEGFKNIRLHMLQEMLDEYQAVTQTMLPQIGLDGWSVNYAIERETKSGSVSTGLTVTITKPGYTKPVKWEAWSGGEKQRLRLIGAVALSETLLRRAGVECDLMIFDEPTRHLSPEGVLETMDFLIERGREGNTILYIDHAAPMTNRFASTVLVTKDEKGVRIDVK